MIEVGEYYRTKNGKIKKVEDLDDYDFLIDKFYFQIVKHSKNIIDLIEVGDYVNGMQIDEFDDVEGNLFLGFPIYDDGLMNTISEFRPLETVDIKSIVTREQFAQGEYKVKE